MIEVTGLTKRYGNHVAVDHLSFRVEKGRYTVFGAERRREIHYNEHHYRLSGSYGGHGDHRRS